MRLCILLVRISKSGSKCPPAAPAALAYEPLKAVGKTLSRSESVSVSQSGVAIGLLLPISDCDCDPDSDSDSDPNRLAIPDWSFMVQDKHIGNPPRITPAPVKPWPPPLQSQEISQRISRGRRRSQDFPFRHLHSPHIITCRNHLLQPGSGKIFFCRGVARAFWEGFAIRNYK